MILKWSQKHSCTHLRNHKVEDCCSYDYQNNPRACHWPIDSWGYKRATGYWHFTLFWASHENFSKVFVGKNSTIPRRISDTDISEVIDCRQEKKKKKHFKMFHYRCTSAILLSLKHQLLLLLLLIVTNPCNSSYWSPRHLC